MARQLIAALRAVGHEVEVISELRSFAAVPEPSAYVPVEEQARREIDRISGLWSRGGPSDLWFTYHPFYKAPDLLGPVLTAHCGVPYVTAETSYSERRNVGVWARTQSGVLDGIDRAAVNICLTERDRDGILVAAPQARVAMLPPFIDAGPFLQVCPGPGANGNRMIAVGMMRPGDKTNSYRLLAEALGRLSTNLPWTLSVVGDGPMKAEVMGFFSGALRERINWHGEATSDQIAKLMADSAFYVWPGYGEAYGLAYLEAQAAGLPVVAQRVAGVPEAVLEGVTALLTPPGDADAFASGIEKLLTDRNTRAAMAAAAHRFVATGRTLDRAAQCLDQILAAVKGAQL
jgi:glycosyltransferase involved in cell wall biosynthesis